MNENLLNILAGDNPEIDSQKLLDYIRGKLSREEAQEVERALADSEFMNDAVEGLKKVKDEKKLHQYVERLNKQLRTQIRKKKLRRQKRSIREAPLIYFAIAVILLLCLIAYAVLRQFMR
jgi:anti-sigma factor RsiW